jgi:hypothetical protein
MLRGGSVSKTLDDFYVLIDWEGHLPGERVTQGLSRLDTEAALAYLLEEVATLKSKLQSAEHKLGVRWLWWVEDLRDPESPYLPLAVNSLDGFRWAPGMPERAVNDHNPIANSLLKALPGILTSTPRAFDRDLNNIRIGEPWDHLVKEDAG